VKQHVLSKGAITYQPPQTASLLLQLGVDIVPTNQPGDVPSWNYSAIGGTLPILAIQMPQASLTCLCGTDSVPCKVNSHASQAATWWVRS